MLDTIELSKKLISFDSVTPAKQDIFNFLIKTFEENGFSTKQLNFDGDGSYEVINLMATYGSPNTCLLYTSPSPRDGLLSRMPSSA